MCYQSVLSAAGALVFPRHLVTIAAIKSIESRRAALDSEAASLPSARSVVAAAKRCDEARHSNMSVLSISVVIPT